MNDQHGLENIKSPALPPETTPNPETQQEIQQWKLAAEALGDLTPKALHLRTNEKLIAGLEKDKNDLKDELRLMRGELDVLRPKYARLDQARRTAVYSNNSIAVLIAIGGTVVSAAGVFSNDILKFLLLALGWGLLIPGLVMIATGWRLWPTDAEPTSTDKD